MIINPDNELNLTNIKSRQALNQTNIQSPTDIEVKKFIDLEKKKYKKNDEINDMINRY